MYVCIGLFLPTTSVQLPGLVVQRTGVSRLDPLVNAVVVERMATDPPSGNTLVICVCHRLRLALNTGFHDVVPADSTVVHRDVPRPKRNRRPLLHCELLSWRYRVYVHLVCHTVLGGISEFNEMDY